MKKKKQTNLDLLAGDIEACRLFGPDRNFYSLCEEGKARRYRISTPYYTIAQLKAFHKKLGKLLEDA